MVKVYVHLIRPDEAILDEEGVDVMDILQAVLETIDTLKDLQESDPLCVNNWIGWTISISDESGIILATIPLDKKLNGAL